MTRKFVSDEIFGRIATKIHELTRRIKEGTLEPKLIEEEIQRMIENMPEFHPDSIRGMAKKCSHRHPNGGGRIIGGSADPGAYIGPDAIIGGKVWIRSPDVRIKDNAIVYGEVTIDGKVEISDSACVFGKIWLMDSVKIFQEAWVQGVGGATLAGEHVIRGSGLLVLNGNIIIVH